MPARLSKIPRDGGRDGLFVQTGPWKAQPASLPNIHWCLAGTFIRTTAWGDKDLRLFAAPACQPAKQARPVGRLVQTDAKGRQTTCQLGKPAPTSDLCISRCYALKGRYAFSRVKERWCLLVRALCHASRRRRSSRGRERCQMPATQRGSKRGRGGGALTWRRARGSITPSEGRDARGSETEPRSVPALPVPRVGIGWSGGRA
jgi:hypothetical protein